MQQLTRYLVIPGWQGSGQDHWQTHWQEILPNTSRVEQLDWDLPDLQSWVAQLDSQIRAANTPAILIAHSLGCVNVAHWASRASDASLALVRGALLVAPADVERPGCPEPLRGFAPLPATPLPFPSILIGSDNDRAASASRAIELGQRWGSETAILAGAGHINAAAGFHRWDAGFGFLYRLQNTIERRSRKRA